jgi:hypothetical protein
MPAFVDARLWMARLDGIPAEDCALSDEAISVVGRLLDAATAAASDPELAVTLLRLGQEHNRQQGLEYDAGDPVCADERGK